MRTYRIDPNKKYIVALPEEISKDGALAVSNQIDEWLDDKDSPILVAWGNVRLMKVTKSCAITRFLLRCKEMLREEK